MKLSRHYILFTTLAIFLCFEGCKDKQEIKVYRVSKAELDPAPSNSMGAPEAGPMQGTPGMSGMPGMPGMAGQGSPSAPEFTGTAPSNWQTQPPSSMRQASYKVKGESGAEADVSLITLAGEAGGTLENVNRWLTQIGQPQISEAQLGEIAKHITTPLGDVLVVDLEGKTQGADATKAERILAGMASIDGKTLFFKMRGNSALVESQKEGFMKWIESVHSSSASGEASAGSAPSPLVGTTAAAADPGANAAKPQVKWDVPQGWISAPASSMRYASFSVSGANGETGDVSVSFFPGESGGDLANVNRWRGQVGLAPVTDDDLKSVVTNVTGGSAEFMLVDLVGQKRLLAGWTRSGGNTWFFKLTGSDALVGAEKEKFITFLKSVNFQP